MAFYVLILYKKNLSAVYSQTQWTNHQKPTGKVFSPVYAKEFVISLYKKNLSAVYKSPETYRKVFSLVYAEGLSPTYTQSK